MNMDPYKTLNVSKEATDIEIKKAYRKLAAKHHPDKGGEEGTFKQINEAYSLIENEQKRQEFDAAQNFNNFHFENMFGNFSDIFEGFFGARSASRQGQREQTDEEIIFDLKISLSQIKEGISQNIVFNRYKECHKCDGIGGQNKNVCPACQGHGVQAFRLGPMIQQTTCRTCFGAGHSFEDECTLCSGAGTLLVKESVKFTVENK